MVDIRKTFLGYDLGDGESITDCVTLSLNQIKQTVQIKCEDMKMPGITVAGKAVPTAYAYDKNNRIVFAKAITLMPDMVHDIRTNFKRRPTDLIPGMDLKKEIELKELFSKTQTWPNRKDCNTPEMQSFKEAVITFTNAVFNSEDFKEALRSEAVNSDEIVFNVGHPTKWSELDALIYKQILRESVIGKGNYAGKKTVLDVAAESRAAYLAVRDKTQRKVLPKGTSALLIDTGSSTVDLTALSENSHNYQYNSGSNYLGVRSIDFALQELYLKKLAEFPEQYQAFQRIALKNPSIKGAITLAARQAKEELYSTDSPMANIYVGPLLPIRIMDCELEDLISQKPVAEMLRKYSNVPEAELQKMGSKSWEKLFEEFLTEQKSTIAKDKRNLKIGCVIMTGSATRMPVVARVVKRVFRDLPQTAILKEMDPSRSISKGLALVGVNEEKTVAFNKEVHDLIKNDLPNIIKKDVPALSEKLSPIIYSEIHAIIFDKAHAWKAGDITTLEEMTNSIKYSCNEQNLNRLLSRNTDYTEAVETWCKDVIGPDIAVKLKEICEQFGVRGVSVDSLNCLKIAGVDTGDMVIDPGIADALVSALAAIVAVIGVVAFPTILGIILGIIGVFSFEIMWTILVAISALPGVGVAFLIGLFGVGVFNLIKHGGEGTKKRLVNAIQGVDIPLILRKVLTDNKLESEITKANIPEKIKDALNQEKTKNELANKISAALEEQINKCMEDIKYMIQSE